MKRARLVQIKRGNLRKIATVLERLARTPDGKTRIMVWSQNSRCWSKPQCVHDWSILGPAPADWPQTKSARAYLDEHGLPAGADLEVV